MRTALIATTFLALSACGGSGDMSDRLHADATPSNIHLETAKYFETSRSRVQIGGLKSGMLGTAYKAKVSGTLYDCRYFKKTVSCNRA